MARNRKPNKSAPDNRPASQGTTVSADRSKPIHADHKRESEKQVSPRPPRRKPAQMRLPEKTGVILETFPDKDYALLDSGQGQKLERYGKLKIIRPEGQAIWQRALPESQWRNVDAIFTGDTDEEGMGRWQFPKDQLAETFPMQWDSMPFFGRFTSFRHTGVFPEQAAHWRFMADQLMAEAPQRKELPRVLNLFGYTGIASLVAARAGAHVTHVDASKKAIGWARENQQIAGLDDKPIRWICEDAMKFCEREVRRGSTYDGILLDPPAFGRGPKGEVWQMFEDIPYLVDLCRELMSPRPMFTVLTAYTIRASFLAIHELMQEVYGDLGGRLESGELTIKTENSERRLSTSMFSRWNL